MIHIDNRTWLIRYSDNTFSRPLREEELKQMFNSGEMKPQDEICPGDGYWFSLQDVNEMRKHFGNMLMDGIFKKVNEEKTQERDAATAPLVVPPQIKVALKQAPATQSDSMQNSLEIPIHKAHPLMKVMLIILTIVVLVLLFVWFG